MAWMTRLLMVLLVCSLLTHGSAFAATLNYRDQLAKGDDKLDSGEFADAYPLELAAGQVVELTMSSDDFDTYLMVIPPADAGFDEGELENDDVSDADLNSRLVFVVPKAGTYKVVATSAGAEEAGAYHVRARIEATAVLGREQGELTRDDRVLLKGGEYADVQTIKLGKGEGRVLSVVQAGFDAILVVHTPDGEVMIADEPPTLLIQAPDNKGGEYRVVITSYEPREVGAYTLEVRGIVVNPPGMGQAPGDGLRQDDAHRPGADGDERRRPAAGVAVGLGRDALAS